MTPNLTSAFTLGGANPQEYTEVLVFSNNDTGGSFFSKEKEKVMKTKIAKQ